MKQPLFDARWPESWRCSYEYDLQEVFGRVRDPGYVYAYQGRRDAALSLLTGAVEPPARILDVAAGQGNFSLTLAEMGYRVTWNDLRADLADYVRLKHERGHVEYVPGNILELPFDSPFDAVLMTEVIEHVAHPDSLLRTVGTLVRPGGYIVITTPNGGYFRNRLPRFSDCADPGAYESVQFRPNADGHIFLLHPDEIGRLAHTSGLSVEELQLITNPLTSGHLKTAQMLHVLPARLIRLVELATRRMPRWIARAISVQMAVRLTKVTPSPCVSPS